MSDLDERAPGWGSEWVDEAKGWDAGAPRSPVGMTTIPAARGIFDTPGTYSPHTWTPGQKWAGGVTPPLAEYYPIPPAALHQLPYIRTLVPESGEGLDYPLRRRPNSQTVFVQQSVDTADMVAATFTTVASLDLTDTTRQLGFEGLVEHAVGWAFHGMGEELITWRVTLDGLDSPVLRQWTGPWHAEFVSDESMFLRVPYGTILRVEALVPAGFPEDILYAVIKGQVWPTNRPGHTTAGDLRR